MKASTKSTIGTSYFGATVIASVRQLEELLGEAPYRDNRGDDKVNFEWNCETDDGNAFCIYDWKEYRPLSMDETIEWHIGAKNGRVSMQAAAEVTEALIVKKSEK